MSVYKNEKAEYLNEALESIWTNQTRKPQQIVLVEDGPLPQELRDVINRWKDNLGDTFQTIQNKQNLGLTKSLNEGLQIINTDLVARMDTDDVSMPERFAMQERYLNEHPDIDIVGGYMQEFNAKNPCLNIRHYPLTHSNVLKSIYKASPLAHPTVMMRMSMFREGGLHYDERFRTSQDIALWFDAICAGYKIGNLDRVTFKFRLAEDMFKRRSKAKAWNEFRIYMNGIQRVYGKLSPKYIYPISRLMFRLMPVKIVKLIYGSQLRRMVIEKRK